jgi:nicotinamide riboside kinase
VGLARRVVVVGAESTGTTTLAADLAGHADVPLVAEYGRAWSAAKLARARQEAAFAGRPPTPFEDLTWTSEEFTVIAATQHTAMDRAAEEHPLVVADTDGLATSVWHDRYVGGPHPAAEELARAQAPHLYLLTSPVGVAFEDDGLRDGEHLREAMTEQLATALADQPVPWALGAGTRRERLDRALALLDRHAVLPTLADPLG